MTYGEIYKKFKEKYPDVQVSDYRPAACFIEKINEFFCPKQDGIIVWTKDGDTLIFYPESLGDSPKLKEAKMELEGNIERFLQEPWLGEEIDILASLKDDKFPIPEGGMFA